MFEFNSSVNGELHNQEWVKDAMKDFHNRMDKLVPFECNNCQERWPSTTGFCAHCKKNPMIYSEVNYKNLKKIKIRVKTQFQID